jgi:signal transduction histidine kinase
VSAWYGGLGPGIAATLLTTLLSAIFFFAPTLSLAVSGGGNQVGLAVFMLEAGVISGFSGALRSARQRAEQAVQVRDHFLAVAAHELKTPLTSLLAYTQALHRRLAPGASITERDRWALQVMMIRPAGCMGCSQHCSISRVSMPARSVLSTRYSILSAWYAASWRSASRFSITTRSSSVARTHPC